MTGNPKVLDVLQKAARAELLAVCQYETHARLQKSKGYSKISKRLTTEHLNDERKHLKMFMDRIIFLGGTPDISYFEELHIGKTIPEQFENDLSAEYQAVEQYKDAIKICFEENDSTTREIFEHILAEEEGHADDFETQLSLINEVELTNYLSRHCHVEAN